MNTPELRFVCCFTTICAPVQYKCIRVVCSTQGGLYWIGCVFYAPIKTLKEVYMGHIFYLSKEKYYTVGTTITPLFIILLTIIAFMWIHIEQQDEIISNLHMKISERERSRLTDKDAIRAMCWKELFDRIDNSQKQTIP